MRARCLIDLVSKDIGDEFTKRIPFTVHTWDRNGWAFCNKKHSSSAMQELENGTGCRVRHAATRNVEMSSLSD